MRLGVENRFARDKRLFAALTMMAMLAAAPNASAYCRTTTARVTQLETVRGGSCKTDGLPLFWRSKCVGYSIQKDATRQVAFEEAQRVVARAFQKWTEANCATDGTGTASISVRDLGPVTCARAEYNEASGNQNVIVFRDTDWPHNDVANTIALTTVTFDPASGEIYDADVEINSYQAKLALTDPVSNLQYDLASIITHEAGHFFGLSHSSDRSATMYAQADPGSTLMRNINADDISGICAVYPANGTRTVSQSVDARGFVEAGACSPTPRNGLARECTAATTPARAGMCSLTPLAGAAGAESVYRPLVAWACLTAASYFRRRRVTR